MKSKYLKDSAFLKEIDALKNKELHFKIEILDWAENPVQSVEGMVLSGSLNLNGNSAVRRSISLSMVTKESEINFSNLQGLFALNKKARVQMGVTNVTNKYEEEKIIWFPLGIFVMMSPNLTRNTSGINISLRLEDKMSLLNGNAGGTIPAAVMFGEYDDVDESGAMVRRKVPIVKIIQELVNHYGGESLNKIIISDIDNKVKKVIKWTGNTTLYMIQSPGNTYFTTKESVVIDEKRRGAVYQKFEYGDDIGFVYSDFYYPGDLNSNAGDSVCTILDKIKNTLGNFEYFYDVDGNFIFREIKNYLNTSQAKVELDKLNNNDYYIDRANGKSVYSFNDSNLIMSYSNSPKYEMIKNDFIVWGIRKTASGTSVPIRFHLAIDKKPEVGNTYHCFMYDDESPENLSGDITKVDSVDTYVSNTSSSGTYQKAKVPLVYPSKSNFPPVGFGETFYYAEDTQKTYKWALVVKDTGEGTITEYDYAEIDVQYTDITTSDWRTELYLGGVQSQRYSTDSNYYFKELVNEWPKLYDIEKGRFRESFENSPSKADYFLDFIDVDSSLAQLNVSNIGRRTKVVQDNNINCIFEPDIPDYVLIESDKIDTRQKIKECTDRGQNFILVNETIFSLFRDGGSSNSAYNAIRELLYQYTNYNESITIQCLPIYYLEPNTRITVNDAQSGIYGDYIINSISLPFMGNMTIQATRALERV